MESQLKIIEMEYCLYEADEVSSENELLMMLVDSYQCIEEERKLIQSRIGVNQRTRSFSNMVSDRMRGLLNLYCPEYYEDDIDFLMRKDEILDRYYDQVVRMIPSVREDNFLEISKLASFIKEKCASNCFGIEVLRCANKHYYGGEKIDTSSVRIDSIEVSSFFEGELSRIIAATKDNTVVSSYQKK